jgi:hypothetical protein
MLRFFAVCRLQRRLLAIYDGVSLSRLRNGLACEQAMCLVPVAIKRKIACT